MIAVSVAGIPGCKHNQLQDQERISSQLICRSWFYSLGGKGKLSKGIGQWTILSVTFRHSQLDCHHSLPVRLLRALRFDRLLGYRKFLATNGKLLGPTTKLLG